MIFKIPIARKDWRITKHEALLNIYLKVKIISTMLTPKTDKVADKPLYLFNLTQNKRSIKNMEKGRDSQGVMS